MSKNDGGPAFPFEYNNQTSRPQDSFYQNRPQITPGGAEQYGGMTLRDYFAAAAMQGMFANPAIINIKKENGAAAALFHKSNIALAFKVADIMLAERNKK